MLIRYKHSSAPKLLTGLLGGTIHVPIGSGPSAQGGVKNSSKYMTVQRKTESTKVTSRLVPNVE